MTFLISHLTISEPNFHETMQYLSNFMLFLPPRERRILLPVVFALLQFSL